MNFFVSSNHFVSKNLVNFAYQHHLEKFIGIMADLPIFFAPVFLVAAWIYYTFPQQNTEKKKDLIAIFFSIVFSILTNLIIQHFFFEQRPETFIKPILDHLPDASFPSDHAAVSFAFLTSLYLSGYKKIFWIYLPFVILMNISRIAGGVHWLWDILVGMFIGIFWAFIAKKFRKSSIFDKISNFILKIASFFKL